MVNRPKIKGTAAETAVVNYLREHGWPYAERRSLSGAVDKGDVTGTPGLAWEVKAAGVDNSGSPTLKLGPWLTETGIERINANADFGILVIKPFGMGIKNVGGWYAAMLDEEFSRLRKVVAVRIDVEFHMEGTLGVFIVDGPCTAYTAATLRWSLNAGLKSPTLAPNEVLALTLRPPGTKDKPEQWYRVMSLEQMIRLLHVAGYGDGDGARR